MVQHVHRVDVVVVQMLHDVNDQILIKLNLSKEYLFR